jgi:cysteine desulfurase family protein (TIGR01976 family)
MKFDVEFARSQFPAFQTEKTRDWAFFENAGGSYVPGSVIHRLRRFFVEHKVQPYGAFELSKIAGEAMDESYAAISQLINAHPNELTIGPSTTLNFYVLAHGLRHLLKPGDEIVVTNQDHEANVGCWRRLSERGVVIREWQVDEANAELDIVDLEKIISARTKLVCCTLCSNLVGSHNDIQTITEMAHNVGALVVADGVSYAPHVIPNVQTLGVDFYAYSTYKTFGPHQGVLWASSEALKQVEGQGHFFNEEKSCYLLNPTGPQHAQIAALAGITEYIDALYRHHFDNGDEDLGQRAHKVFGLIAKHEACLANILLDYVKKNSDLHVLGQNHAEPGKRASTISFYTQKMSSRHISQKLAEQKIGVGNGNFYAPRCLKALNLDLDDGVVRVSMVHYNTEGEVNKLVSVLDRILNSS